MEATVIDHFSARAEECLRLSLTARTRRDRELLLEFARAWLGLADEAEAERTRR
jgi:hypothetical protein